MKQCYHIVWGVEEIQKVKTQALQNLIRENYFFYQNMQCVAVKNQDSLIIHKLVEY